MLTSCWEFPSYLPYGHLSYGNKFNRIYVWFHEFFINHKANLILKGRSSGYFASYFLKFQEYDFKSKYRECQLNESKTEVIQDGNTVQVLR